MFRRHTTSFASWAPAVMFGECCDAADGGGGGGAAPAGGGAAAADAGAAEAVADAHAGDDADAADRGDRADADADDADAGDDDERLGDDELDALPEANVRTRLRKTQRFVQRHARPLLDKLRDPATGKFLKPDQVDAMLNGHREFTQIDSVLRRSPRAVQVLIEEQQRLERGDAGGDGAAGADAHPAFDEANWPFETESKEGQALLAIAKANHELQGNYKRLEARLAGVDARDQKRDYQLAEGSWKKATFTAADELPREFRHMFIESVRESFEVLRLTGRLNATAAGQVIDRKLAGFRASRKKAARDTTTRQSEMIAGNRGLPRTPRPGTVQPANGRESGKRETMKDASAGFLGKYRG